MLDRRAVCGIQGTTRHVRQLSLPRNANFALNTLGIQTVPSNSRWLSNSHSYPRLDHTVAGGGFLLGTILTIFHKLLWYHQKMAVVDSETIISLDHHARLVVGDRRQHYESIKLRLQALIEAGRVSQPDVWYREYETVSIDDARNLKEIQSTKPIGDKRYVLFSLNSIQTEAQNSLLKLFEEPNSNTVFIVCVSHTEIFLPTLLSRFQIWRFEAAGQSREVESLIRNFVSIGPADRLKLLEVAIKDKNRAWTEDFLNSLEVFLARIIKENKPIDVDIFTSIFSARRYLRSRSPSVKMILENICCTLPILNNRT